MVSFVKRLRSSPLWSYEVLDKAILFPPWSGDTPVAATILLTEEEYTPSPTVSIYTATFFSPVAGTIYFRQVEGGETTVFGKLYHVTSLGTTSGHPWSIQEYEVCYIVQCRSVKHSLAFSPSGC